MDYVLHEDWQSVCIKARLALPFGELVGAVDRSNVGTFRQEH